MKKIGTHKIVRRALTAAVYAAACLALPMLSYGPVQVRFSEALTLLPVFSPPAIWGAAHPAPGRPLVRRRAPPPRSGICSTTPPPG